jgi:hypothetical protein
MPYERTNSDLRPYAGDSAYAGFGAITEDPVEQTFDNIADSVAQGAGFKPGTRQYDLNRKAFKWAYNETMSNLDKLAANPTIRRINQAADAAIDFGASALQTYQNYKNRSYTADANGVIAASMDVNAVISSIAKFSQSIGLSPEIAHGIAQWSSVATGCAAGIAAQPIFGAVACAFTTLTAAFSLIFAEDEIKSPLYNPRSIFTPNPESQPRIAEDMVSLCQVLTRHYGVVRYTDLTKKLVSNIYATTGATDDFYWLTTNYPARPPIDPVTNQFAMTQVQEPVPAHNLRSILQIMSSPIKYGHAAAEKNIKDCLAFLAAYRSGFEPAGRGLYRRYDWDNDINVDAIETGAWIGRSAIATTKKPMTNAIIMPGGNVQGHPTVGIPTRWDDMKALDWSPFIAVDELINYFTAITIEELRRRELDSVQNFNIGSYNPVRLMTVRDRNRSGEIEVGEPGFSDRCFTNLNRHPDTCQSFPYEIGQPAPSYNVIKQVGAMRLMAAFSYLHIHHMWSNKTPQLRDDLISVLSQVEYKDEYEELRIPINPRQTELKGVGLFAYWSLKPLELPDSEEKIFVGYGEGGNSAIVSSGLHGLSQEPVPDLLIPAPYRPTLGGPKTKGGTGWLYVPARTNGLYLANQIHAKEAIVRSGIKAAEDLARRHHVVKAFSVEEAARKARLPGIYQEALIAAGRPGFELVYAPKTTAPSPVAKLAVPALIAGGALLALRMVK